MTITIIQGLWKEGSKKKKLLWKCLWPQACERKATRKIIYSKCTYDHVVRWNFRLRFELSSLPPLKIHHFQYYFLSCYRWWFLENRILQRNGLKISCKKTNIFTTLSWWIWTSWAGISNFQEKRKTSVVTIAREQFLNVQQWPNQGFCLSWILNTSTLVDGYKPNLILWLDQFWLSITTPSNKDKKTMLGTKSACGGSNACVL
jgi:hypothetical protein